ncbi:hypothetical protein RRG08_038099 [Elysia crispata]|uniref:Uncharacterized protein n=1 Tax=Elysia crispata TaxID=231223 RepID=A0AAE1A0A0_9GAST|nr:hypothetical protein RRG08_038099 [Elysia crispata]
MMELMRSYPLPVTSVSSRIPSNYRHKSLKCELFVRQNQDGQCTEAKCDDAVLMRSQVKRVGFRPTHRVGALHTSERSMRPLLSAGSMFSAPRSRRSRSGLHLFEGEKHRQAIIVCSHSHQARTAASFCA